MIFNRLTITLQNIKLVLLFFAIIYSMPHGHPLGQQSFAAFAVYADALGVGRERCLLKYLTGMVQEPGNTERDAWVSVLIETIKEELGIGISLLCGQSQPLLCRFLILLYLLPLEKQLPQRVLGILISLCGGIL